MTITHLKPAIETARDIAEHMATEELIYPLQISDDPTEIIATVTIAVLMLASEPRYMGYAIASVRAHIPDANWCLKGMT